MSSGAKPRLLAPALAAAFFAATLVLASLAAAERPPLPGGTVPSTLSLSLSEPSPFTRSGAGSAFTATIRAEVSATDAPLSLGLEGEEGLRSWSEPVSRATAKLRLHREGAQALRGGSETVVVTLTAGGP